MKKLQILFLLLGIIQFSFTQEVEFGKVSSAELQEKAYAKDSSANAVILYKNQKTYFNANTSTIEVVTEIHERIKIYSKEGFDKATISVDLFKSSSTKERISKVKAFTFNLENGEIKKTELDKDQIYKTEYNYYYNNVKFTLPNVKEGSILDIKYKIKSPFYYKIDDFNFQYDIPVKKIEAELRTPDGVNFNTKPKGYIDFFPKRFVKRDLRIGMKVNVLNYTLEDVPALKEERFVNNINNYRAGVVFELTSIVFPGESPRYYSQTWGDVARMIGSSDDYKIGLDKTNSFDDTLDDLISSVADDSERMKMVFKFVKENVKWNGVDGKYFQKGIRKALKEKKGNAADVNLTLVAMLRYADLDANPVIISTRDNLVPFFPTLERLNYVIAYVVIDDKQYFLDATEEFSDINMLPIKDYNWRGILVDNNKKVWRNIEISEPSMGLKQQVVYANINEEGVLEGNFKGRYSNHSAYEFRNKFSKKQDLDAFLIDKEESLRGIEISDYKVKNTEVSEGNVFESFSFYKESYIDIIDNKMYIIPSLFFSTLENPFKTEKREYPIDFGYPVKERYMTSLKIPAGYSVESIPKSIILMLPESLGKFQFSSKVSENKINLVASIELKSSIIGPAMYPYLKEFFAKIISKQKEQVVLTKAE